MITFIRDWECLSLISLASWVLPITQIPHHSDLQYCPTPQLPTTEALRFPASSFLKYFKISLWNISIPKWKNNSCPLKFIGCGQISLLLSRSWDHERPEDGRWNSRRRWDGGEEEREEGERKAQPQSLAGTAQTSWRPPHNTPCHRKTLQPPSLQQNLFIVSCMQLQKWTRVSAPDSLWSKQESWKHEQIISI